MQKARCHTSYDALQLIVSTRFQVLFHSPPGVLFTFPSRYYFTIGYRVVFSLTPWAGLIPTGLLVSRSTRAYLCGVYNISPTGLSPSPDVRSSTFDYIIDFLLHGKTATLPKKYPTTPGVQRLQAYTYHQV